MPDGFARLAADFGTAEITLLSNWRSHNDLVTIQHVIAQKIDAQAQAPKARVARKIAGDVSAIRVLACARKAVFPIDQKSLLN
jgi:hypothetical protein